MESLNEVKFTQQRMALLVLELDKTELLTSKEYPSMPNPNCS